VNEILPRVFHWTAHHQGIRQSVSSYLVRSLEGGPTLIDPMLPGGGLDALREPEAPARVVLTNRHHYRHSAPIVEAFGGPVLCERSGLHEFEGGPEVEPFEFGQEVAPGITALEVGAICSEETALHVQVAEGALAFADGLISTRGGLGFVPDALLGDDPGSVKRGLRDSLRRLLDRRFDHLLFAHGRPLVGGGKEALGAFLDSEG
jgi:hypothetical protein